MLQNRVHLEASTPPARAVQNEPKQHWSVIHRPLTRNLELLFHLNNGKLNKVLTLTSLTPRGIDVLLLQEGGPPSSVIAEVDWSSRGQTDHVVHTNPASSDVKESRGNWILGAQPLRFEGEFNPENIQGMFGPEVYLGDDDVNYSCNGGHVATSIIE
eukprot:2379878-Prorocentrum_lima.AAC.1